MTGTSRPSRSSTRWPRESVNAPKLQRRGGGDVSGTRPYRTGVRRTSDTPWRETVAS